MLSSVSVTVGAIALARARVRSKRGLQAVNRPRAAADTKSMRSARLLALVAPLAVLLAGGCFLNEIDKAQENLPGVKKDPPKSEPAKPATSSESNKPNWWSSAKTLGSEESSVDIAKCELNGQLQFMARDDCLSRGGTPR